MSIWTELNERRKNVLKQEREQQEALERKKWAPSPKFEPEARKFIEEVIIPRFRKMAELSPTDDILLITFHSVSEMQCKETIPYYLEPHIQCNINIAREASKLASQYDIQSEIIDTDVDGRESIDFCLIFDRIYYDNLT